MRAPRPDGVFRIGGLIACGIVALPLVTHALTDDVTLLTSSCRRASCRPGDAEPRTRP